MSDTVFRGKTEEGGGASSSPELKGTTPDQGGDITSPELPYMDYGVEHSHPFLVDHYAIGDRWNDPVGGFPKEVDMIENYIQGKIKAGEIGNSLSDVKTLLKGMEKLNNLASESRLVVKLEILSNYVEFLMKNDKLRGNLRRYSAYS